MATNSERRKAALMAIQCHMVQKGEALHEIGEDDIVDLIADIQHYHHSRKLGRWNEVIDAAETHFEAELEEEE